MALEDGITGVPKPSKHLHLCCLKAFQMFFNSCNGFDSPTELISSINKAFYEPLMMETESATPQQPFQPHPESKKCHSIVRAHAGRSFQDCGGKRFPRYSNIEPFGIRVLTGSVFPLRFPMMRQLRRSYSRVLMPPTPSVTKPLFWWLGISIFDLFIILCILMINTLCISLLQSPSFLGIGELYVTVVCTFTVIVLIKIDACMKSITWLLHLQWLAQKDDLVTATTTVLLLEFIQAWHY